MYDLCDIANTKYLRVEDNNNKSLSFRTDQGNFEKVKKVEKLRKLSHETEKIKKFEHIL